MAVRDWVDVVAPLGTKGMLTPAMARFLKGGGGRSHDLPFAAALGECPVLCLGLPWSALMDVHWKGEGGGQRRGSWFGRGLSVLAWLPAAPVHLPHLLLWVFPERLATNLKALYDRFLGYDALNKYRT